MSGGVVRALTPTLLRRHRIAPPDDGADKDGRGRVLIVGGCPELAGAIVLAGTAALRAGAGKLQLATAAPVALVVAVTVPESRVVHLPATRSGGIAARAASLLASDLRAVDALLIGPGMREDAATERLVERLVERLARAVGDAVPLVLDAGALRALSRWPGLLRLLGGRAVITPHAGEMAQLLGEERRAVERAPLPRARRAAADLNAVVVLKGSETLVAAPDGRAFRYSGGRVGLATSGSGDVLAGIVAGLAARGASALDAALWAVHLHGEAGNALARRHGTVGFLARELAAELPALLDRLS